MNNISKILIIFFMFYIFISAETIRITNGEWEPYLSKSLKHYGIASHIVSEAFKLENIDVEWGFFLWSRAYEEVRIAQWDASAVWWVSEEKRNSFLVSDPLPKIKTKIVFFHRKDLNFDWKELNDLKKYKIGMTVGYDYGGFKQIAEIEKLQLETTRTDEQSFNKLILDRLDLFPNDLNVGYSQLKNNFTKAEQNLITHHPKSVSTLNLHLLISRNIKKGTYFLEKFNSGLKKLQESGKLDQMLEEFQNGEYNKDIKN